MGILSLISCCLLLVQHLRLENSILVRQPAVENPFDLGPQGEFAHQIRLLRSRVEALLLESLVFESRNARLVLLQVGQPRVVRSCGNV